MATVALTEENFTETIQENDIVLVDFWAEWCGPCKSFAPTFEKSSEQHDDVLHAKVDTEEQQRIAQEFGIRSIPTIMAFREQVLVFSQPGALPPSSLEELITQVKNLDMEDVRAQMAEHEAEHADH